MTIQTEEIAAHKIAEDYIVIYGKDEAMTRAFHDWKNKTNLIPAEIGADVLNILYFKSQ